MEERDGTVELSWRQTLSFDVRMGAFVAYGGARVFEKCSRRLTDQGEDLGLRPGF